MKGGAMDMDFGEVKYGKPLKCSVCGNDLVYKGVGEYRCSACQNLEYDDYGKVRLYIEKHSGATATEISEETGVSQAKIRQMLKEERLEVSSNSIAFLRCEICGIEIRSGKYCEACDAKRRKEALSEPRAKKKQVGYGSAGKLDSGERRFHR